MLQKYRIYLIGALLFSVGILVGYFLNPEKHENLTAQEWYLRYREVSLSRAQIVDCINTSLFEMDPEESLEEVRRCTFLVDLVPVDIHELQ